LVVKVVIPRSPPNDRVKTELDGRNNPAKPAVLPPILKVPRAIEHRPEHDAVLLAPERFSEYAVTIPNEFTEICPESCCPLENMPETL